MIFHCLETCYCWHKKVSSSLSIIVESILTWHLSNNLVTPPKNPAFQPHWPIWSFQGHFCFKHLCPSFMCWKYPSPFLLQIIQKIHSSSVYEKPLLMRTELRILQIHTHSLHAFPTNTMHKHIHHKPKKLAKKEILEKIYQILEPTDTWICL